MVRKDAERQIDKVLENYPNTIDEVLTRYPDADSPAEASELFKKIADEIDSFLFHIAYGYVRNEEDAKDIRQMVLLNLVKILKDGKLKKREDFFPFVKVMTSRASIDFIRRNSRRTARENREIEAEHENSQTTEDYDDLWRQVSAELSKDERELLEAHFGDKEAAKKYGEILGLSDDALKKRKSRALTRARQIFDRIKRYAK